MADWFVQTRAGKLHRAEMKDAGDTAGPAFSSDLISDMGRYDLCERCFPKKEAGAPVSSKKADLATPAGVRASSDA